MIQDPTDQYIAAIISQYDLGGKEVLEIGCGKGRITRDLARHARRVVATDPDSTALQSALTAVDAGNVEFVHAPAGVPEFPAGSFDAVIYSLSLHHVPVDQMNGSLCKAAGMLRNDGVIVVVEPGDSGSFTEVKERFAAGSGDERPARQAALCAMQQLEGWSKGATVHFRTLFQFADDEDFFSTLLTGHRQHADSFIHEVKVFLEKYRTADGIILEADRQLNLLKRS